MEITFPVRKTRRCRALASCSDGQTELDSRLSRKTQTMWILVTSRDEGVRVLGAGRVGLEVGSFPRPDLGPAPHPTENGHSLSPNVPEGRSIEVNTFGAWPELASRG